MGQVAELTPEHTLTLPLEIAARFKTSDRFVVWSEGEPLSLDEINEIVHEVRHQRWPG